MAVRGRKPKPVELKILEGNPGNHPLNDERPKPAPLAPRCPSWLSRRAKAEWRRVAPELETLGLLTTLDMAALASYCQAWARVEQCTRVLDREGLTYESRRVSEDDDGEATVTVLIKARPEVAMEQRYIATAMRLCVEFGMTASSRGRMVVPGAGDDDDDDEFLSGPRRRTG